MSIALLWSIGETLQSTLLLLRYCQYYYYILIIIVHCYFMIMYKLIHDKMALYQKLLPVAGAWTANSVFRYPV